MVTATIAPPVLKPDQFEMIKQLTQAADRLRAAKSRLEILDAMRSVTHWHHALKQELDPDNRTELPNRRSGSIMA